jgi:transposase-like protein
LINASFLPNEADCAETWRAQRWPNGVWCMYCRSTNVECQSRRYRGYLCRYCCRDCRRWFNDLTGTELEYCKVNLSRWVYLMRELDKGRPVAPITKEIEVTYKTALRMAGVVRRLLYLHRIREPLEGEVERDDIHLKGSQQGRKCRHFPPHRDGLVYLYRSAAIPSRSDESSRFGRRS